MNFYQYSKTQLASELKTDLEKGLSEAEFQNRLAEFGPNELPEKQPDSWLVLFFRQFKSSLIYILLICAVLVFVIGEHNDAYIILAVLVINAAIGSVQEGRSGKILAGLKKLSPVEVSVLRGGKEVLIPQEEVVLGDVLVLLEGQRVAADARVVFCSNLALEEAALTGESGGVQKNDRVISEDNVPMANRRNMVFKGTTVLSGTGRAAVTATGMSTEIGKISQALLEPEEEIPLQKNIRNLSKVIIVAVGFVSASLLAFGVLLNRPFAEMFAIVVSLAVSIIPEGLPLVLTLILAHGVWRMSKRNALVKKMQAVEALGQASVLAVDKTGTLTENEMVVQKLFAGGKIYQVTGDGYEPKGNVLLGEEMQNSSPEIVIVGRLAALAGKARVFLEEDTGLYKVSGDPTEAALAVFGEKLGFGMDALLPEFREVSEMPFDYKLKYRATFFEHDGKVLCVAAGAVEALLPQCEKIYGGGQSRLMTAEAKKQIEDSLEEFSSQGLRVVAVGFKYQNKTDPQEHIKGLTFAALFAIQDALRPQARESVLLAQQAGVRVVMITGDHKNTARAIAAQAGIYREGDVVVSGNELLEMTEQELAEKLPRVSVFARVAPEDKMKLVKAYKRAGLVVAMTGDGVNDAPSLVAADLGVGMGKIGTEVAKEAADIVLLDDNLGSIITAIQEGRVMHQNIKRALQFLFSTSLGELLTIVAALFLNIPMPVVAVQILWLNLITDPLIGAALALETSQEREPGAPGPKDGFRGKFSFPKYFVDLPMLTHMLMVGLVMCVGVIWVFSQYRHENLVHAQSIALTLLAVFQWYNGFNCRYLRGSLFKAVVFSNPYLWLSLGVNFAMQIAALHIGVLQGILKTTPLSAGEWMLVLLVGLAVIAADEVRKLLFRSSVRNSLNVRYNSKGH